MTTSSFEVINREIAQLEKQLSDLHRQRVDLLREKIRLSEAQIEAFSKGKGQAPASKSAQATSPKEAAAPAKKERAAGRKPRQPKKRTRTPTAQVEKRILDSLKEAGSAGLSQIEVSKKSGLGYQTVLKKLKELPQIAKKGAGKKGRFFLKA